MGPLIHAWLAIRKEAYAIEEGRMDRNNNPLKNAPHTMEDLVGEWDRPYSREAACFQAGAFRVDKYWTPVNRVDNVFGDRNLVCSRHVRESCRVAAATHLIRICAPFFKEWILPLCPLRPGFLLQIPFTSRAGLCLLRAPDLSWMLGPNSMRRLCANALLTTMRSSCVPRRGLRLPSLRRARGSRQLAEPA